jgi:hypothetical protein
MKSGYLLIAPLVMSLALKVYAEPTPNSVIGIFTDTPSESINIKAGTQLTITGLNTNEATVVFPDSFEEKMKKLFEDSNLVVIQMVSPLSGSVDTIFIDKHNKRFLLVASSSVLVPTGGKMTASQYRGNLK